MERPDNGITGAKLAPQGEIARLLDELNSATLNLLDNTDGLRDSLQPVLRNDPGSLSETTRANNEPGTDIGNYLAMIIGRIQQTNEIVADSRLRIEL